MGAAMPTSSSAESIQTPQREKYPQNSVLGYRSADALEMVVAERK